MKHQQLEHIHFKYGVHKDVYKRQEITIKTVMLVELQKDLDTIIEIMGNEEH